MTKIRFRTIGKYGLTRDLEMPAVPRIGDHITISMRDGYNSIEQEVHDVEWYPQHEDFDVYVILR